MDYRAFLERRAQHGAEHGFEPTVLPDFLFDFQRALVEWAVRKGRAAIFADCGLGKLQPVDEPVLTPSGWKPIGDVRIGDCVIGSDGMPTRVTGVYPQGEVDIVRVEFSDGSWTRCGWEHLWAVQSQNDRARGKPYRVMTTRAIVDAGICYGASGHRNWSVPIAEPWCGTDAELPIDPYELGVMLGDGHIRANGAVKLTTDRTILDAVGAGTIRDHERTAWVADGVMHGRSAAIRSLGLAGARSHEKFVPDRYLVARPGSRLALLQGLMDTDGHALPDGGTEFSSVAEELADAVVELARGLGGVARKEDERHIHPLQLDVIERAIVLWSNPGEVVLTPFAGVGSEVFGAVVLGRRGVGIELKESYYRQAVKNIDHAARARAGGDRQASLFPADALAGIAEDASAEDDTEDA